MFDRRTIVATTALTIEKYCMIPDKSRPVPVAFSGGKDSLTTILILQELGYDVRPVIVNRGDDPAFNPDQIAEALKVRKGTEADILHLRDPKYLDGICQFAANKIKGNLFKVDHLGPNESMCTPCYNARTTALIVYAQRLRAQVFVIGQHLTDMLTTLMKCYWTEKYYLTFTKPQGLAYDGYRMADFIATSNIDLQYAEEMAKNGRATTDDPPVENISEQVRLVRPLSEVKERDIALLAGNYPHSSTNCTWRERMPWPFRLLAQRDLYKRIATDPEIEDFLFKLVLMNLNDDGTLKHRPRNLREEFYPGFKPFIEKF
jgi:tRNA(Ile)-lysidine synthase TilS/MesJ